MMRSKGRPHEGVASHLQFVGDIVASPSTGWKTFRYGQPTPFVEEREVLPVPRRIEEILGVLEEQGSSSTLHCRTRTSMLLGSQVR